MKISEMNHEFDPILDSDIRESLLRPQVIYRYITDTPLFKIRLLINAIVIDDYDEFSRLYKNGMRSYLIENKSRKNWRKYSCHNCLQTGPELYCHLCLPGHPMDYAAQFGRIKMGKVMLNDTRCFFHNVCHVNHKEMDEKLQRDHNSFYINFNYPDTFFDTIHNQIDQKIFQPEYYRYSINFHDEAVESENPFHIAVLHKNVLFIK